MRRLATAASAAALAACAATGAAWSAPATIHTAPVVDPLTGQASMLVGAVRDDRLLKLVSIDVTGDGSVLGPPRSRQSLADFAAAEAEAKATWKPPLAVGLVYLWTEGSPPGVIDGVRRYLQQISGRTSFFPTPYGQDYLPSQAWRIADKLGDIETTRFLKADRPNLAQALRWNLENLKSERADLKVLLVVSDMRDFVPDPSEDRSANFLELGQQIADAGVILQVVAFPPPPGDEIAAGRHIKDLRATAPEGSTFASASRDDLDSALEAQGQSIGQLQFVRFDLPSMWRMSGGRHTVALDLGAPDVKPWRIEASLEMSSDRRWLLWVGLGVVALSMGAVLALRGQRQGSTSTVERTDADDEGEGDPLVQALHDLIRRGLPPERAAVELTRGFSVAASGLAELDPAVLSDARYPYFRTKAGRVRVQEILEILARKSGDDLGLGPDVVAVLVAAISERTDPEKAADMVAARVPADQWSAFSRLSLEELAQALKSAGVEQPVLATPRARGAALAIQDALHSRKATVISVGWLVRAAGPGRRGETLRLPAGTSVLGRGAGATVRLDGDTGIVDDHARIIEETGEFLVEPLGGQVKVEGAVVAGAHRLADGETMELGAGQFVFKSVTTGDLRGSDKSRRS